MRFAMPFPIAVCLAVLCISTPAAAVTTFVNSPTPFGPSPATITFDEFALGTNYQSGVPRPPNPVDPSALAVPGHDVWLQSSLGMTINDFDASFPGDVVPGLFEGQGTNNPAGSTLSQLFQVRFGSDVSAAGLVIFNNFGTEARSYALIAYDSLGAVIGTESGIMVQATPQVIGFTSDQTDIAVLELGIGPTFGTGRRPFIDTIMYVPEPGTALLMGLGLAGLALRRHAARAPR